MHRQVLAMALACLCLTGCAMFQASGDMVRKSLRKPNGGGGVDEGLGTIDEGRTQQFRSIRGSGNYDLTDPLLSPTARDIEQSVGAAP